MALFWKNILVFGACVGTYNFARAQEEAAAEAAADAEVVGANGELNAEATSGEQAEALPQNLTQVEGEEDLKKALDGRTAPMALYVFEGSDEAFNLAKSIASNPALFASVTHVKTEGPSKLTVYKGRDESSTYSGSFEDSEAVMTWAQENRIPLFGEIAGENFEIYVESARKGLMWACFDPKTKDEDVAKYTPAFVEAAKNQEKNEEQYPFVWLDINQFGEHAKEELGCKVYPTIVLQRGDLMSETPDENPVEKFIRTFDKNPEELDTAAVDKFFTDIASGELKAEPIPDPLDALDDDDDDEEDSPAPAKSEEEELDDMDDDKEEL